MPSARRVCLERMLGMPSMNDGKRASTTRPRRESSTSTSCGGVLRKIGYSTTHPLELTNTKAGPLYHMVFATDHPAGTKIMSSLYTRASKEIPAMRQEARDRATGQAS